MVRSESVRGNPARKILEEIDRLAPNLVLLGYSRRGRIQRLLHGGVADAVVRRSDRPLLLVPSDRIAGKR